MNDPCYATEYFSESSSELLAIQMDQWFASNPGISLSDVSILTEMKEAQLSPGKVIVVFVALVTYKIPYIFKDLTKGDAG